MASCAPRAGARDCSCLTSKADRIGAHPTRNTVLNLNAYRAYASLDNSHRISSYQFALGTPAQSEVPEPGSLALNGLAQLGLAALFKPRTRWA